MNRLGDGRNFFFFLLSSGLYHFVLCFALMVKQSKQLEDANMGVCWKYVICINNEIIISRCPIHMYMYTICIWYQQKSAEQKGNHNVHECNNI